MLIRSPLERLIAVLVVIALQALTFPVAAGSEGASLDGAVFRVGDESPLPGARLHAGNTESGETFVSKATSKDGAFRLGSLPPARYRLAVEADGGLYVVDQPIVLAEGQQQFVQLAISPANNAPGKTKGKPSPWSNPGTATAIVIGIAVVLGVVVDQVTDHDTDDGSPSGG